MAVEKSLGWLHLTDIHVGQPSEGGRLANIERAFLQDLTRVVTKVPIAVIFVTGDIAFRGSDAEYVRASALLGRICGHVAALNARILGHKFDPVLIPVPGNHDLARPTGAEAEVIRGALGARTAGSPDLWPATQENARDLVDRAFASYQTWLRFHPLPFPPARKYGALPGDLRSEVTVDGISLGVIGLNSACLHLGDVAPGSQHIDLSQLRKLAGNTGGWLARHHFNVLMTHHPPSWLTPTALRTLNEEIKPDALFDLHLYGHDHMGRLGIDPGSSGVRHLLEGRSLFGAEGGDDDRMHGYSVGRFVIEGEAGAQQRRVEFYTRQGWRDGHGWHFGASDEKWGQWRITVELGETRLEAVPATPPPKWERGLGHISVGPTQIEPWRAISDTNDLAAALADSGKRWIFLSASVPGTQDPVRREAERRLITSAHPERITRFVVDFAREVRRAGHGLIFGGHPSITQALAPLLLEPGQPGRWLALVQDQFYWDDLVDELGVLAYQPSVSAFLVLTAGEGPNPALLRKVLLTPANLAASVFVGGMSGVTQEFALSGELRPEVPRFAVGLGGGAAAELLLDPDTAAAAMGATTGDALIAVPAKLWHTPATAVEAILAAIAGTRVAAPATGAEAVTTASAEGPAGAPRRG